jgi:hypothetical protein
VCAGIAGSEDLTLDIEKSDVPIGHPHYHTFSNREPTESYSLDELFHSGTSIRSEVSQ